jgi:hypothetical protein
MKRIIPAKNRKQEKYEAALEKWYQLFENRHIAMILKDNPQLLVEWYENYNYYRKSNEFQGEAKKFLTKS